MKEWEVVVLLETWLEEKEWRKIKRKLPKGYVWRIQWANRKSTMGRAIGGMTMGINKEIAKKERGTEIGKEGFIMGRINRGGDRWKIIGIYARKGMEKVIEGLEQWVEDREEEVNTIIKRTLMREQEGKEEGWRWKR